MQEFTVSIRQHRRTGLLVATSSDLPGLSIAGNTIEEIEVELEPVIRALLEAQGEQVEGLDIVPMHQPDRAGFVADGGYRVGRRAA